MTTVRQQLAFTIGYEGRGLPQFVKLLTESGVERVVDVRALPLSRRKGFSKTPLRLVLAEHGIEYIHVRAAGNPYRAERDNASVCLMRYAKHLDAHPEILSEVESAIDGHRVALLCFEVDARMCHRGVIANRLQKRSPKRTFRHL